MGGLVVLSFLRGLTGSVLRRAMFPAPTPYYVGSNPALERGRSIEWLLGLGLFVGLMLLLNAGKGQVESWWNPKEMLKKPPSSAVISATDSTSNRPKAHVAFNSDSAFYPPSVPQSGVVLPDSIYVQIGAYTQEHRAQQLARSWIQSGYSALLLHHDAEPLYKLCIGPFSDAQSAKTFIRKFPQLKGFLTTHLPKP